MAKNQKVYRAFAVNGQGASINVSGSYTSQRAAEDAARAELGSGWKVSITCVESDGDSGWFGPVTVKTFTVR